LGGGSEDGRDRPEKKKKRCSSFRTECTEKGKLAFQKGKERYTDEREGKPKKRVCSRKLKSRKRNEEDETVERLKSMTHISCKKVNDKDATPSETGSVIWAQSKRSPISQKFWDKTRRRRERKGKTCSGGGFEGTGFWRWGGRGFKWQKKKGNVGSGEGEKRTDLTKKQKRESGVSAKGKRGMKGFDNRVKFQQEKERGENSQQSEGEKNCQGGKGGKAPHLGGKEKLRKNRLSKRGGGKVPL